MQFFLNNYIGDLFYNKGMCNLGALGYKNFLSLIYLYKMHAQGVQLSDSTFGQLEDFGTYLAWNIVEKIKWNISKVETGALKLKNFMK